VDGAQRRLAGVVGLDDGAQPGLAQGGKDDVGTPGRLEAGNQGAAVHLQAANVAEMEGGIDRFHAMLLLSCRIADSAEKR